MAYRYTLALDSWPMPWRVLQLRFLRFMEAAQNLNTRLVRLGEGGDKQKKCVSYLFGRRAPR